MKRATNLFESITDYNNLRAAYLKALKGKRFTNSAILYSYNTDEKLMLLKQTLENGSYVHGEYRQFKIFDPKERLITAASFQDRIVHHAIINVLEPVFERQYIFHSYACRKGKGTHRAIEYVRRKTRSCRYFLKLDMRKYFDNIDHSILKEALCRIIKDARCLMLLFSIIDSFGENGKGLPIGNLTSQFFANLYLSSLDHYVLENLKPDGYVRYMDDIVVFSNSMKNLKKVFICVEKFCRENLNLSLKQPAYGFCTSGVPFLGFLTSPSGCRLLRKNLQRKKRRFYYLDRRYVRGLITEQKACESYTSMMMSAGG